MPLKTYPRARSLFTDRGAHFAVGSVREHILVVRVSWKDRNAHPDDGRAYNSKLGTPAISSINLANVNDELFPPSLLPCRPSSQVPTVAEHRESIFYRLVVRWYSCLTVIFLTQHFAHNLPYL